jgi:tetrahydromethanopterin S-methyltransferase subunit D
MQPPAAYADASVKQGDYIMVNGSIGAGVDVIYVINVSERILIGYYVKGVGNVPKSLEKFDKVDLDPLFRAD